MVEDSLVSVIIPTYNRADCVGRAIDSVLVQSYGSIEVVVIDDGSTDETTGLIQRRYGSDPRVRYYRQENAGIAGARNAGLTKVAGAFVALLDSDDYWDPWKLELQIACMRAHPELGMTWTDMIAVDPSGKVISEAYLRRMYSAYRWFPTLEALFRRSERLDALAPRAADIAPGRKFYFGEIGNEMVMGNLVHTSTVVLTRARAETIGAFREDLRYAGEDYEFHLRTCRAGPVGFLDIASIRYQRGRVDQATVPSNSIHLADNFLRVIEPILKSEGNRIRLPRRMQIAVLAEAYASVGEARLDMGEPVVARREFVRSLMVQPLQARTARLLFAACLPHRLRQVVRRIYRAAHRAHSDPAA